jgi:hypothetical protein
VDRTRQRRAALAHASQISPSAAVWRRWQLQGDTSTCAGCCRRHTHTKVTAESNRQLVPGKAAVDQPSRFAECRLASCKGRAIPTARPAPKRQRLWTASQMQPTQPPHPATEVVLPMRLRGHRPRPTRRGKGTMPQLRPQPEVGFHPVAHRDARSWRTSRVLPGCP